MASAGGNDGGGTTGGTSMGRDSGSERERGSGSNIGSSSSPVVTGSNACTSSTTGTIQEDSIEGKVRSAIRHWSNQIRERIYVNYTLELLK